MYQIKEYNEKYNKKINDFIIGIYVEEFGFEEHREYIQNENNNIYSKSGGELWIAMDENKNIIGTIALFKHNENEMELKKFYIKEEHRGTGLSKELYNKAIEKCKSEEIKRVFLGTFDKLEKAIYFYLKRRI